MTPIAVCVRRHPLRQHTLACLAALALCVTPILGEEGFQQGDWPFRALERTPVPEVKDTTWPANPIDRFVLRRLEDAALHPSGPAERLALLRRVTFDLTGVPPTIEEQDAFLADASPDAYEKVVDRLLDSPRFGERWAQHWLDLVRFAETEGFKSDRLKENAWRYRDYVIRAFNDDLPYDRFLRQQLAGDELEPDNPAAIVATGFLRLCPDEDNAANLFQRRQELLSDVTDTTALAFMGLTVGCAQCHDHKFDPILQSDYYRLQAFFAAMTERDDAPAAPASDLERHRTRQAEWEEATRELRAEIDALAQPVRENVSSNALEKYEESIQQCYQTPEGERTPEQQRIARMIERRMAFQFSEAMPNRLDKEQRTQYEALQKRLTEFDSLRPEPLPQAMAVADLGAEAPGTHLLDGGNWRRPLQEVQPGFPEFLDASSPAKAPVREGVATTGRRSQLAAWLTRPDHPLTARVIVNRFWQQHFGQGIIATPNDFGLQGAAPTHPELLDWLAAELVENGWSLKHIHRLMVTSATYRQTSLVDLRDENAIIARQVDGENKLLWHARRRRLEGESIRDAMLQTAGELNVRMYGPSSRPELPEGVSARYAWKADDDPADRNRRSVYVFVSRNMRFPLFEAFDQPDLHQSCPRRPVTITAPQSLLMLNSKLTAELAEHWAERLLLASPEDVPTLVGAAYRAAYGRAPGDIERQAAERFIAEGPQSSTTAENVVDFCHAIFNSNEFITID